MRVLMCVEVRTEFTEKELLSMRPLTGLDIEAALLLRTLKLEKEPVLLAVSGRSSVVEPLNFAVKYATAHRVGYRGGLASSNAEVRERAGPVGRLWKEQRCGTIELCC